MTWWKSRTEAVPTLDASALAFSELKELARSYDGYQREAVVAELVRRQDPRAIAILLVCVDDWVPGVGEAAKKGLVSFMRDEFVGHWAHALPELAFAYRIRRTDLRALRAAIEDFFARNTGELERQAPLLDDAMRRWIFTLRLQRANDDLVFLELLTQGVLSRDPPTAQLCLNAADRLRSSSDRRKFFEVASRACLPRVRAEATRVLLGEKDFDVQRFARSMCFDTSAVVRSLVVNSLAASRDEFASRATEILELAQVDARKTAALHVLHLLQDSRATGYARLLQASKVVPLRRLARWLVLSVAKDEEVDKELMEILADASPKVRRLAVEHIRRGASLPRPDALMRMGLERQEVATEVMAMLRSGSPWDRLLFVMALMERGDLSGDLCHAVTIEVDSWCKAMANCYVPPKETQRAALAAFWSRREELLSQGRPRALLPYGFPSEVELHLRAFRII
ncbi:hypothetical protein CLU95_2061 [Variovorax sp. 54]|uniref:hypothetical protein n=1 Tax=Variovorax sp. 54 TaxID=2035212 RepID=UPI000C1759A0|nr:hypothetical protein [Variovorax sp. 54]PIF74924.1 hypothetical protein CLU95_2061 [Variovorax sp. 54]